MATAFATDAISVQVEGQVNGEKWVSTNCPDGWDSYKRLPQVIEVYGERFALRGFNSDKGRAYYCNRHLVVGVPVGGGR